MDKKQRKEKMDDFFDSRAESYDQHMKRNVDHFEKFYRKIADSINETDEEIKILDIGCGTGLELEYIFRKAPNARIIAVDLSQKMIDKLKEKYNDKLAQIKIIKGSYLTLDFKENEFDYVVSVMTVHHLLPNSKKKLYTKIFSSLKAEGKYLEGDYIVSEEKEKNMIKKYKKKIPKDDFDDGYFHIDLPSSIETEETLLKEAGFRNFQLIYEQNEAAVYIGIK